MSALKQVRFLEAQPEPAKKAERSSPATSKNLLQQNDNGDNAIVQIRMLSLAADAARFGSRPPVISALTGIKEVTAKKIYKDVTGNSPPKGQLPGDASYYTSGLQRHIESIWLLQTYKGLLFEGDTKADRVECTIQAYSMYCDRFAEQNITFDRFFLLVRLAIYGKQVTIEPCSECDGPYLTIANHTYSNDRACPVCEMNTKLSAETKLTVPSKTKITRIK